MDVTLTHFSLFTGIGGLDLAAEWAGFETVGQCEWADYPTKVLEKHWPNTQRWRDIREITRTSIRNRGVPAITVMSGGDPCQPHSTRGKRNGTCDDRYYWPEMFRVIEENKPTWVINENVAGSISNGVVDEKIHDLETAGYEAVPFAIPAVSVGAFHKRERIFIIANASSVGLSRWKQGKLLEKTSEGQSQILFGHGKYGWNSIPTPGICRGIDGIPNRMDRLKCLGNAVVPYQAYPIFQAIHNIEMGLNL